MNTLTQHRPLRPHSRSRLGAQLLRIGVFTASVLTIAGFVAADVLAAEPSSLAERLIFAATDVPVQEDDGPALFASAIHMPEGTAPPSSSPPPPPPSAKRSTKKLRFGRFEGY